MRARGAYSWLIAGLMVSAVPGCTAKITGAGELERAGPGALGPDGQGEATQGCGEAALLPARLWRLTGPEYLASVQNLLGQERLPEIDLEVDPVVDGFKNNANALSVSTRMAGQLQQAASTLSVPALSQFARYSACAASAFADAACVQTFIASFGARAFRRPLTADEVAGYLAVYQAGVTDADAANGVRLVVQTLLQSPHFLYRSELGDASSAKNGVVQLDGFELASALSFSLWGTPPDEALLSAAAAGRLSSAAELTAQTRRLLEDQRALPLISRFVAQWLSVQDTIVLARDPVKYPELDAVKGEVLTELERLAQDALLGPSASLSSLFFTSQSHLSPQLASFYGVQAAPAGTPTSLAGSPRVGLLTSAALLASWSRDQDTSPMTRGRLFIDRVLCQDLPAPPAALDIPPIPLLEGATTRDRYAAHATIPGCAACHQKLDAVAFALENFDSAGRYRNTENGKPVDASGIITETSDADGPFQDMTELATRLSGSKDVRACLARQYVRFVGGAGRRGDNACMTERLVNAAAAAGDSPRELIVSLATSDFFRARAAQ